MLDGLQDRLEAGVQNLLVNCGQCLPGQRLLLVHETEDDGYYGPGLMSSIKAGAERLGLVTDTHAVPLLADVSDPDRELAAKLGEADCTVFLARLGDQIRFRRGNASMRQIISYALDREMLASPFGTIDYAAFLRLKELINHAIAQASDIHVTCPEGTDFRGGHVQFPDQGDVTRKRFPVSVFSPVPAFNFRGRVAQNGFLTGTGSHYYTPWSCELKETLHIHFDGNRITGFDGSDRDVDAATAHYEFVGSKYGIETFHVHSWHAGIHPGCAHPQPASASFERWSGSAFGNPRLLHFHTCGAYPPGEISLNVLDPTVRLDGVPVWDNGMLHPDRIPGGEDLLSAYPEMARVFRHPAMSVGQGDCGRLSFR